jgi:hypothetical protein
MKIYKSKKFQAAWGAVGLTKLQEVFQKVCESGFSLANSNLDVYSFSFHKSVDNDLTQVIYVSHTGEHPTLVYNFDCFLTVHSKWLSKASDLVNPEAAAKRTHSPIGNSIFVITQSHLRWNEELSVSNPSWCLSELQGYEESVEVWFKDWQRLMYPLTQKLKDLPSVIDHCTEVTNYKANPWVKSDGYHVTLAANTALLLYKNNEKDKAIEVLKNALSLPVRQPILNHFHKVLNWIESSPQSLQIQ